MYPYSCEGLLKDAEYVVYLDFIIWNPNRITLKTVDFYETLSHTDLPDEEKFDELYAFALNELNDYAFGSKERQVILDGLDKFRWIKRCYTPSRHNNEHYPTDYRHGRKRTAYQRKNRHRSMDWNDPYGWKCSKSWKDQSKRRHQYHRIVDVDLYTPFERDECGIVMTDAQIDELCYLANTYGPAVLGL